MQRTQALAEQMETMQISTNTEFWNMGAACISNRLIEKYPSEAVGIIAKIAAGKGGIKYRDFDELLESLHRDCTDLARWLIEFQKDRLLLVADVPCDEHLSLLTYKDTNHAGNVIRVFWLFDDPYDDNSLSERSVYSYLDVPNAHVVRVEEALCDYDFRYIKKYGTTSDEHKFKTLMSADNITFELMLGEASSEAWSEAIKHYRATAKDMRCGHE